MVGSGSVWRVKIRVGPALPWLTREAEPILITVALQWGGGTETVGLGVTAAAEWFVWKVTSSKHGSCRFLEKQ